MFLLQKKIFEIDFLEYRWSNGMYYKKGFILFPPHPTLLHMFLFISILMWNILLCFALSNSGFRCVGLSS